MRAKSFLHVSLGLLALALAYHLGAASVGAQAGVAIEGANCDRGTLSVAVNRIVYRLGTSGEPGQMSPQPVPGTSPIITTSGYSETWAMTADGKAYLGDGQGGWILRADFAALGAVPTSNESWGGVKVRYRGQEAPSGVNR